jgi:hypothetical protein
MKKLVCTLFVTSILISGCNSSTSSSGISEPVTMEREQNNLFRQALGEGKGLASTNAPAPEKTSIARCKIQYSYLYPTQTYITLKGCAFTYLKLTGNYRITGASLATVAKSRNMFVWINHSGSRIYSIAI